MSAAEKLRALDDLSTYPSGVIARSDAAHVRGRLLLDALPELRAVVEAAEMLAQNPDGFVRVGDLTGRKLTSEEILSPALAALDAALGGEE